MTIKLTDEEVDAFERRAKAGDRAATTVLARLHPDPVVRDRLMLDVIHHRHTEQPEGVVTVERETMANGDVVATVSCTNWCRPPEWVVVEGHAIEMGPLLYYRVKRIEHRDGHHTRVTLERLGQVMAALGGP